MFPDRAGWDLKALLLGKAVDYLGFLAWAKTKGARHGSGRPKSVLPFDKKVRPGAKVAPAPLSVVRARMARLHRRTRSVAEDRAQKIRNMFRE